MVSVTFKGVLRLCLGKFCVLDDYWSLIYRIGGHLRVRWSHIDDQRFDCGMVLDMASGLGKPEQLLKMKHCFEMDEPCARSQNI